MHARCAGGLGHLDAELGGAALSGGAGGSEERLRRKLGARAGRVGTEAERLALEARSRAVTVLGGGHGFTDAQVSAVMALAGRLAPGGRAGVAWFDVAGGGGGLHPPGAGAGSVTRRRTFRLLAPAADVFGGDGPTPAPLASLPVVGGVGLGRG